MLTLVVHGREGQTRNFSRGSFSSDKFGVIDCVCIHRRQQFKYVTIDREKGQFRMCDSVSGYWSATVAWRTQSAEGSRTGSAAASKRRPISCREQIGKLLISLVQVATLRCHGTMASRTRDSILHRSSLRLKKKLFYTLSAMLISNNELKLFVAKSCAKIASGTAMVLTFLY